MKQILSAAMCMKFCQDCGDDNRERALGTVNRQTNQCLDLLDMASQLKFRAESAGLPETWAATFKQTAIDLETYERQKPINGGMKKVYDAATSFDYGCTLDMVADSLPTTPRAVVGEYLDHLVRRRHLRRFKARIDNGRILPDSAKSTSNTTEQVVWASPQAWNKVCRSVMRDG